MTVLRRYFPQILQMFADNIKAETKELYVFFCRRYHRFSQIA